MQNALNYFLFGVRFLYLRYIFEFTLSFIFTFMSFCFQFRFAFCIYVLYFNLFFIHVTFWKDQKVTKNIKSVCHLQRLRKLASLKHPSANAASAFLFKVFACFLKVAFWHNPYFYSLILDIMLLNRILWLFLIKNICNLR